MPKRTFVGFGFGAVQAGLFLSEAFDSGAFDRLVAAEVQPARVDAIRGNGGAFTVNVATAAGRAVRTVAGVEIFNPNVAEDAAGLVAALGEAADIAVALPSIAFYDRGRPSVAALLRAALGRKLRDPRLPAAVVYAAENDNHAAEALHAAVCAGLAPDAVRAAAGRMQMLNTVIGKMSSVVTDPARIRELALSPIVPGAGEAFLVEAFNRILISRIELPGFARGIAVFEEQPDLLPFEEAKLYGHNAVHALLGFLAHARGLALMSQLPAHPELLDMGRKAFIGESGAALVRKYGGRDPLFTDAGMRDYAEDLLARMVSPWLQDPIDRVIREPIRKLGWNDRLIGAIRLTLGQGLSPDRLLQGARAALRTLAEPRPRDALQRRWASEGADAEEAGRLLGLLA